MTTRSLLQLNAGSTGVIGERGFTLTGVAREGRGLCRVALRRMDAWHRNPDPRILSEDWDLRIYTKTDSAFVLMTTFTVQDLEQLEEDYAFPDGREVLAEISLNGDPVHDRVLVWARRVTGAPDLPAPAPVTPANIEVRYSAQSAGEVAPTLMPLGRSTPPMQPIRAFSPGLLRPQHVNEAPTNGAPARPATGAATAAPRVPARPASPAAAGRPAAPPRPAGPPGAASLTERLQALKSKGEATSDSAAKQEAEE